MTYHPIKWSPIQWHEVYDPIEWRLIQWHSVNGPMAWNSIQLHFSPNSPSIHHAWRQLFSAFHPPYCVSDLVPVICIVFEQPIKTAPRTDLSRVARFVKPACAVRNEDSRYENVRSRTCTHVIQPCPQCLVSKWTNLDLTLFYVLFYFTLRDRNIR